MKQKIKNKFFKLYDSPTFNTWSSLAARSLNIVVLIPFILKKFSPAEISLWYLFGTIVSFNFLFELGFGPSFIRAIAYGMGGAKSMQDKKGDGKPNLDFLYKIWKNTKIVYLLLSILFFIILISGGYFLVEKPISFLSNDNAGWIAWYITIFGSTFSFWGNMFTVFLQGVNKIAVFRRYETLFSILSIISCAIGIQLGLKFVGLVALTQFWIVLGVFRNLLLCRKDEIYRAIRSTFNFKVDVEIIKDLWKSSWRSAIGMVMSYGIINSSSLYFAQIDNVGEVSSYLFCLRILQIIINFSMAPFYTKIPSLSKLFIIHENNKIIEEAKKGMRLSHFVFVLSTILIGLIGPFLLKFIGSSIDFIDSKLWSLLILAFFIERYGAMHMQLFSISNVILWHIANSVTGLILAVLMIILIPSLSFYAFPIAIIISYLSFYSWFAVSKSLKMLNVKWFSFEKNVLFIPFFLLVLYLLFVLIFH